MKYLVSLFLIVMLFSCKDNASSPSNNSSNDYKVKITIYQADLKYDTNSYRIVAEMFFDGDVKNVAKRLFYPSFSEMTEKGRLHQGFANVPIPINKYGCFLKEIDYNHDSTINNIQKYEYDNEGYIYKGSFTSYSTSNKSSYALIQRSGNRLTQISKYTEDMLDRITFVTYGQNGLIEKMTDSSLKTGKCSSTIYKYDENGLVKSIINTMDSLHSNQMFYYYDNDGYNIRQQYYSISGSDTTYKFESNWVVYRGYLINPEKVNRFTFDSNDNIIGYLGDGIPVKFKIEYEFK